MAKKTLKGQAMTLAAANAIVRGLGLCLRLLLTRLLSPEALGLTELSSGAGFFAVTPLSAGLPAAVSKMTAGERAAERGLYLRAGQSLALRVSLFVAPAFLFLSPLTARLLGDTRAVPSLLAFAPLIPILGLSCALDGAFFGRGQVRECARSDILEQAIRIASCVLLSMLLKSAPTARRAALPVMAMALGEGAALLYLHKKAGRIPKYPAAQVKKARRALFSLCAPLTLSRLLSGAVRMANALLIPKRLIASGLTKSQSVAQFGMYAGMALPVLYFPAMLAGALGVVGTPAIARLKKEDVPACVQRLLASACLIGALSAGAVYLSAPFLSSAVFSQPALRPLFRALCPLCLIACVQAVLSGVYNGLGQQRAQFFCALLSAPVTLALVYFWAARPEGRLLGVGLASLSGQSVSVLLSLALLPKTIKKAAAPPDES